MLLNAGASAININILQGDQSVFTRDISMGGNAYTEAVQKELDLPFEAAEQLKKGIPVDGATFEEAQPVLRAVTENVLLEIQKTFDFFKATASSEQIDRIMLSGGASRVDGFREMVQERFDAPVEEFDPFRAVAWDGKKLGGDPAEHRRHGGRGRRSRAAKGGRPMIRINLLGGERQAKKRATSFDLGQRLTLACSLHSRAAALLASAGGTGRCTSDRPQSSMPRSRRAAGTTRLQLDHPRGPAVRSAARAAAAARAR